MPQGNVNDVSSKLPQEGRKVADHSSTEARVQCVPLPTSHRSHSSFSTEQKSAPQLRQKQQQSRPPQKGPGLKTLSTSGCHNGAASCATSGTVTARSVLSVPLTKSERSVGPAPSHEAELHGLTDTVGTSQSASKNSISTNMNNSTGANTNHNDRHAKSCTTLLQKQGKSSLCGVSPRKANVSATRNNARTTSKEQSHVLHAASLTEEGNRAEASLQGEQGRKEQRRRELYAWNEELRLQHAKAGVVDAV